METDIRDFFSYYSVFYEHRWNLEVFVNIYGFDKMCCKYIYIYILQLGERVEVKQLYIVYSNNKKLILKLYNKTLKQMFVIKYTNIFKYVLFKRWFVWQTCFSFGSCFRIPTMFRNFVLIWSAEGLKSAEVKSLASSFRIFFSFFSRNSFTKTSLC